MLHKMCVGNDSDMYFILQQDSIQMYFQPSEKSHGSKLQLNGIMTKNYEWYQRIQDTIKCSLI